MRNKVKCLKRTLGKEATINLTTQFLNLCWNKSNRKDM